MSVRYSKSASIQSEYFKEAGFKSVLCRVILLIETIFLFHCKRSY
jgi:hypothetical protein